MALHVTNRRAEELTRQFAREEGTTLTDAVIIAVTEALAHRQSATPPGETSRPAASGTRVRT